MDMGHDKKKVNSFSLLVTKKVKKKKNIEAA